MIVCVCATVSDKAISRAISDGARTFDDLQIDLGVALQCGKCESCARGLMDTALEAIGHADALGQGGVCEPELHGLDCAACDPRASALPAPGQLKLVAWIKSLPAADAAAKAPAESNAAAASAAASKPSEAPRLRARAI